MTLAYHWLLVFYITGNFPPPFPSEVTLDYMYDTQAQCLAHVDNLVDGYSRPRCEDIIKGKYDAAMNQCVRTPGVSDPNIHYQVYENCISISPPTVNEVAHD